MQRELVSVPDLSCGRSHCRSFFTEVLREWLLVGGWLSLVPAPGTLLDRALSEMRQTQCTSRVHAMRIIIVLLAITVAVLGVDLQRTRRALAEERAKFARAFPSASTETPNDCAFRERQKALGRALGADWTKDKR